MTPTRSGNWLRPPLIALAVTLSALAIYWPGLTGGFIFDDYPNLVLNEHWRMTRIDASWLERTLRGGGSSPIGRPLAVFSFGLNHYFTGADPFWLKLTGVVFHLVNGLLVFALSRRLLAHGWPALERRDAVAGALTAAWLMHPLQVSSVLYVVQRMELGAALFTLLALLAWIRARESQLAGRRGITWLACAAAATLAGVGFKESAILVVAYAFVVELVLFRFRRAGDSCSHGWVLAYISCGAAASIVFAVHILPMTTAESLYAIRDFGPGERVLTQSRVLTMYLGQIVLPLPDTYRFFYDDFQASRALFSPPTTALALTLLAALLLVAILRRKIWPLTALGIGWFFAGHALTSSVLPLELAFEHRNYLPLYGVLLALAQPVAAAVRPIAGALQWLLLAAAIGLLAFVCAIQTVTWGNPDKLSVTLAERAPASARAVYDLGLRYNARSGDDPSHPAWALARARYLQAAQKDAPLALQGLILLEGRAGRPIAEETWARFRRAITRKPLGPESLSALFAVSKCRIRQECRFDDRQLLQTFLAVMKRNPDSSAAHTLYADFAWNILEDRRLAIRMQRVAVSLSPAEPDYQLALAKFLAATGEANARREAGAIRIRLLRSNRDGRLTSDLEEVKQLLDDHDDMN